MMDNPNPTLDIPPVEKVLTVRWAPQAAFRRFTDGFGDWWPLRTHSVGGRKALSCVLEGRVGGHIYELDADGSRHEWGRVTLWDPPRQVDFTWHPSRPADTAQVVSVRFDPLAGEGTRVTLTHSGWEHWGERADIARDGYGLGWEPVLANYRGDSTVEKLVVIAHLLPQLGGLLWRGKVLRRRAT
jgi:hypothetical protein